MYVDTWGNLLSRCLVKKIFPHPVSRLSWESLDCSHYQVFYDLSVRVQKLVGNFFFFFFGYADIIFLLESQSIGFFVRIERDFVSFAPPTPPVFCLVFSSS